VIGSLVKIRIDPGSSTRGRRGWLRIFGALSLISILITPCTGFTAGTTATPQMLQVGGLTVAVWLPQRTTPRSLTHYNFLPRLSWM
jgi:hypothetical protein